MLNVKQLATLLFSASTIFSSVRSTIYFLPTHSYPDQTHQSNKPEKKQELSDGVYDWKEGELFQQLRRSITSDCEKILQFIRNNVIALQSNNAVKGPAQRGLKKILSNYLHENFEDVLKCIRMLNAKERMILL